MLASSRDSDAKSAPTSVRQATMTRDGPNLSSSRPTSGEPRADITAITPYAREIDSRVQENSAWSGFTNTENEYARMDARKTPTAEAAATLHPSPPPR